MYEWFINVMLVGDMMLVNEQPFLVTLLRNIKMGSVQLLPSCTIKQQSNGLQKVMIINRSGGSMV